MADIELVEQLRKRANVTYDDAKEALDACGDDLLDAIIYLERKGKVPPPSGGSFSSKTGEQERGVGYKSSAGREPEESLGSKANRFLGWLGTLLLMGFEHNFVVKRNGTHLFSIPVIAMILLLVFAFWFTVIAFAAGLFMSCRYSFQSAKSDATKNDVNSSGINTVMDEVAEATEQLKNKLRNDMDYKG